MNGNLIFKKGQVTPLIIVAVLVVAGFVFYMSVGSDNKENSVSPEIAPIHNFVQNCLEEASKTAVIGTSRYGGHFIPPEDSLDNFVPIYLKNGLDLMPTKERVQQNIREYVNNEVYYCVGGFEEFASFDITDEEIDSLVSINDNSIEIDMRYPLSISKGENTYQIEMFDLELGARLGLIYDSAEYLMEDHVENPSSLCVACANDIAEEYNFIVNSVNYDDQTTIMTITDEEVKIDDQALVFNYAIEYGE